MDIKIINDKQVCDILKKLSDFESVVIRNIK